MRALTGGRQQPTKITATLGVLFRDILSIARKARRLRETVAFMSYISAKVFPLHPEHSRVLMKREITIGLAVVAGAALLEVTLVPGIILGGATFLVPQYLTGRRGAAARRGIKSPLIDASSREVVVKRPSQHLAKLPLRRTIAKTITFRLVVTTLDFTTNYIVIGEIATAAGLSTFNLFAGPVFYFAHEAALNYLRPSETSVTLHLRTSDPGSDTTGLTISPALAKTITYRTIATIVDFTTNYVVVGTVAEAMILSATGFVLGPFVYYGHEKAWEYFADDSAAKAAPVKELELPAAV
ncbi:DUF2061 domain-containing protein [Bradyrhizobium sp.]|uniref:DUF2061 domain-containing protein n=1 Tax=Bradyrhizobium sp. TaxID=376 RepID=UPI003C191C26